MSELVLKIIIDNNTPFEVSDLLNIRSISKYFYNLSDNIWEKAYINTFNIPSSDNCIACNNITYLTHIFNKKCHLCQYHNKTKFSVIKHTELKKYKLSKLDCDNIIPSQKLFSKKYRKWYDYYKFMDVYKILLIKYHGPINSYNRINEIKIKRKKLENDRIKKIESILNNNELFKKHFITFYCKDFIKNGKHFYKIKNLLNTMTNIYIN